MIDTFDSRALRYTDCYAQRFMKAGTYRYHVLPAGSDCINRDRPFTVTVKDAAKDATMTSHAVTIKVDAGKFKVDPELVAIAAGDLVIWNCSSARALPYVVVGDKEFFASDRLVNESGFSHAFAAAGEYPWVDAYGSGAGGLVRVKDADCRNRADLDRWHKALAAGTLVTVTGSTAEPKHVDIFTGQTVFFAITKGPGISITDERLLLAGAQEASLSSGAGKASKRS